jgi:nucleoside-diphosphate-sugar epimerase
LGEFGMNEVKLKFAGDKRGWLGDSSLMHHYTSKIEQLGWQPETSIEEDIRHTVRFLKQNPQLLQRA